jgi:DNA-binding NarL/FixJ family response regulator
MYCEEDYYTKMIALGVQGFIVKSSGINILEKGIHEVMAGKTYLCPKFRELVIRSLEAKTAKNAN